MQRVSCGRQARLPTWGWVLLSLSSPSPSPASPIGRPQMAAAAAAARGCRHTGAAAAAVALWRRYRPPAPGIDSTQRCPWIIYALPCCLSLTRVRVWWWCGGGRNGAALEVLWCCRAWRPSLGHEILVPFVKWHLHLSKRISISC